MFPEASDKRRSICAGAFGPAREAAGFSLIELIVVLTIMAIMTAAVVPMYRGSMTWVQGDRATRDVVGLMKYAQERAVADAMEYRFYLDADKGGYWLMRREEEHGSKVERTRVRHAEKQFKEVADVGGGRRALPQGVKLKGIDARFDSERSAHYVAFQPSGACDYATIELHRADKKVTRIQTKGRLGQFEVAER